MMTVAVGDDALIVAVVRSALEPHARGEVIPPPEIAEGRDNDPARAVKLGATLRPNKSEARFGSVWRVATGPLGR